MEILIILGLILLNGLLSMSEIAMVSARRSRLETAAKKGSRAARTALRLSGEPERFLSTIQIGITLIGILTGLYSGDSLAGGFSTWLAAAGVPAAYSHEAATTVIIITVTYLTLVLGELVPKHLGMNAPERIALLIARPMHLLSRIASPFVWLLAASTKAIARISGVTSRDNRVTEEEIRAIIQEGTEGGEIQEVEQDIVGRVFNLGDRKMGSIMTHRNDLVWLDLNDSPEEIRTRTRQHVFNVYPVADGKLDEIAGVVYLKDLFKKMDSPDFRLGDILQPARYFPENQSVYSSLETLKATRSNYGLITNEFGNIEGIVTLKDIISALLGEISENGGEPEIVRREDGSLLVDGQCSFYNFLEYARMECLFGEYEYNTISGLILDLLEHIPHTGEKISWHNMDMEIVDMDGARIDKVLVQLRE